MFDKNRPRHPFGAIARLLRPGQSNATVMRDIRARLDMIDRKIDQLEYFSHGGRSTYVGDNRVLVKAVVHGANIAYLVEADDKILSPWFIITGDYETPLRDFVVRTIRPDSRCLDVGANFGFFACLMARFCSDGRVIAIEPDARIHALVRDNLAINGFGHAQAIHAAAADQAGALTLYRRTSRAANTSIAPASDAFTAALGEPPVEPFVVEAIRVDDAVASFDGRLDLMKVDVEGAEPLVFAGARATIAANPQLTIVMEWSPDQIRGAGFDVGAFLGDLAAMGLSAYDIVDQDLAPLPYDRLAALPYRSGIVLKRSR